MSFTETQVLHSLGQSYILANGIDVDDKGLIMKLDNKLGMEGTTIKPINVHPMPSHIARVAVSPQVTSQFSGLFTLGLLRTLSYFQSAHLAFDSLITNMNEMMQKKVAHILPLFLYLSLAIQGVVIMVLLAQSLLPLGIFFLCGCVCSMGFIFCSTAVITDFDKNPLKGKRIQ